MQGKNDVDALLVKSFKELAVRYPIEKITIKEITDRAGVIRPTFYNHFQDKYELLEWIIMTELLEPMKPLIKNGMVKQALILLFTSMQKEKGFYMKAARLEGQNSFADIVKKCISEVLLEIFSDHMSGKRLPYAWLTPELIAQYHAQSLCFLVLHWIWTGMNLSPEELADSYNYMISHSIEDILKDL